MLLRQQLYQGQELVLTRILQGCYGEQSERAFDFYKRVIWITGNLNLVKIGMTDNHS